MAANQKFIRYEEEIKYEIDSSPYIKAQDLFCDIQKAIKNASQMMTGMITVKQYSKSLRNK